MPLPTHNRNSVYAKKKGFKGKRPHELSLNSEQIQEHQQNQF